MKVLITLILSLTFTTLHAKDDNDLVGYDSSVEVAEACVAEASKVEDKRLCINTCFANANINFAIKSCYALSVDVEKAEFEKVYHTALNYSKKAIAENPEDYLLSYKQDVVKHLERFYEILPSYIEAKCGLAGLDSLGGSIRPSIMMECHVNSYLEAVNALSEFNYSL